MANRLPAGEFYGRSDRKIAVSGLTFGESAYSERAELYLPAHSHRMTSYTSSSRGSAKKPTAGSKRFA